MSDDLANFKPLDPGRVNAVDPLEVAYWCKELKCTPRELVDTVAKVGPHAAEVREALASR